MTVSCCSAIKQLLAPQSGRILNGVGMESFGIRRIAPIESLATTSQYLSIQRFALSAAVLPQFQYQISPSPQFDPIRLQG